MLPLLLALLGVQHGPQTWTYPDLLAALTDLRALIRPPVPGERCVQFSSFDPASRQGPADAKAWFANGDAGHFLRVEERAGRREHVLADVAGPGCVVRIWSANPKGTLFFYVDGAAEPTWSVDFARLTSGKVAGVAEPLAGVRARGANCHLPVPFAKHLKVACSEGGFYYQVNVRGFAPDTVLPSFTPEFLIRHRADLDRVAECLRTGQPWRGPDPSPGPDAATRGAALPKGLTQVEVKGPATVAGFRMRLRQAGRPPDGGLLRQVLVAIDVDGHPTVRVPYSEFFAAGTDLRTHGTGLAGKPLRVDEQGFAHCRFPIPVQQVARIGLETEAEVPLEYAIAASPEAGVEPGALTLHASWHAVRERPTRPFSDHLVLDARGPGRFVGCSLLVHNPVKAWWGEGDEKFYVDGEAFPSTFGTGTEDYFGYAWCDTALFDHPFHGQVQCEGPGNFGDTSVYRFQIADAVPFQRSFRFDLEVWHWDPKITVDYASVAYWYAPAGSASGLPAVPKAAERGLRRSEPPATFVAKDVLEGESLRVLEVSGGRQMPQDLAGFAAGKWSRDTHLWWMDGKPGDRLVLEVPVANPGRQRVKAAFTRAGDYGIVQVWLGDARLGAPIDLYHDGVVPTGEVELGVATLAPGPARLVLELVGRNEKAVPRHMVGLDYLRLEPVRE
ncbi:MAG: DUF2961 domain-containing protein [Planctomycetes bacterium]|nr:DUF2961 domain-containing protein [Planctomycetota bacterium]